MCCVWTVKPSSYQLEQLEAAGSGPGGLLRGLLHSVSRSRGWVLAGAALGQGDHVPSMLMHILLWFTALHCRYKFTLYICRVVFYYEFVVLLFMRKCMYLCMYVCIIFIERRRYQLYHHDLKFMYVCMYVDGAGHDAWIAVNANEVGRSGGGLPSTSPSSSSSGSNTKAAGKIEQVAISLTCMMMLLPMMTMYVCTVSWSG